MARLHAVVAELWEQGAMASGIFFQSYPFCPTFCFRTHQNKSRERTSTNVLGTRNCTHALGGQPADAAASERQADVMPAILKVWRHQ